MNLPRNEARFPITANSPQLKVRHQPQTTEMMTRLTMRTGVLPCYDKPLQARLAREWRAGDA